MKRRIFSLLTCLALVLSLLPTAAFAAESTLTYDDTAKAIYANGTAITIVAGTTEGCSTVQVNGQAVANLEDANLSAYTIYGGSNNATLTVETTSVTIDGGTVGAVYGGGYSDGTDATVAGNTSVTIKSGTVNGGVYGGGYSDGTDATVAGNTSVTIKSGTVNGGVYGGGYTKNNTATIDGSTSVTIEGGTINGNVYGGGYGHAALQNGGTANVTGSTEVVIKGGSILGSSSSSYVYVSGGGYATNNASSDGTDGSATVGGNTSVTISGGSIGGSRQGRIYGGGRGSSNSSVTGDTSVTISGGTIAGNSGSPAYVCGGGEGGAVSGNASVSISGGTIEGHVFGGSNGGAVSGSATVTVTGGTIGETSGGASYGNVYGGGATSSVASTKVEISGEGTNIHGSVYGGGAGNVSQTSTGTVSGDTSVTVSAGTIEGGVYGGGEGMTPIKYLGTDSGTEANITSAITQANAKARVTGDTSVTVSAGTIKGGVYGGGKYGQVAVGTSVTVTGGTIANVYGGSEGSGLSLTESDTSNKTYFTELGKVTGGTVVAVSGVTLGSNGGIYGGGNVAAVEGGTKVTVSSSITGDVYGGGYIGLVTGSTEVTISGAGTTITGDVYGGGNGETSAGSMNGTVTGNSLVTIMAEATVTGTVNGSGGNSKPVTGDTVGVILNSSMTGDGSAFDSALYPTSSGWMLKGAVTLPEKVTFTVAAGKTLSTENGVGSDGNPVAPALSLNGTNAIILHGKVAEGATGTISSNGAGLQTTWLENSNIQAIEEQAWTGNEVEPKLNISLSKKILGADFHLDVSGYTYTYENNVNEGEATAKASNGTHTATANFTIKKIPTLTVVITPGEGMSTEGEATQTVQQNKAITDVVYTADEGYYFPTGYSVSEQSGITVTRNGYGQITISGTPTADVTLTLPAATAKAKEATPTASFTATGPDTGTLSGVETGMQYSTDGGESWEDIESDSVDLTDLSACTISVKRPGGEITLDSDAQTITVTKATQPSNLSGVNCTTDTNNDGKITGTTTAMEYSTDNEFSAPANCGDGETTGLNNGTYYVRVKASGTTLASDYATVHIAEKGKYTITVNNDDIGIISVKDNAAAAGETITVTVYANINAYKCGDLTVTGENGAEVTVAEGEENENAYTYTFTMPGENVVIEAEWIWDPDELTVTTAALPNPAEGQLTLSVNPVDADAVMLKYYYRVVSTQPTKPTEAPDSFNTDGWKEYTLDVVGDTSSMDVSGVPDGSYIEVVRVMFVGENGIANAWGATEADTDDGYTAVSLTLTPSKTSLSGGGTVTLTLTGLPSGGTATVSCDKSVTITQVSTTSWSVSLPNTTAAYVFTASFAGDDTYSSAAATCTVNVTYKSSGNDGGSSGYTPSTPSTQSITVPISGDDNTIHVGATVSGDKAAVKDVDLSKLDTVIGDHVDTGTVTIDFSGLNSSTPITTVEIPSNVVKEIAAAVSDPGNDAESLEIILSDGTSIEFDAVALGEKSAQASGADITISIKASKGNSAQSALVGDRPAYDINVTSGGKHISDMGGMVTVHAPYVLKDGELSGGIIVYYVDDNGNKEACVTSYDPIKKRVNWKTDHLSLYMIDYDESLLNPFTDVSEDAYYFDAVLWAVDEGITKGTSETTFSPDASCTRAQMATFLWRAAGSPDPVGSTNPFTDVSADAYYAKAVQWAVEQGITNGTSETTFSPDADCTRAQMATFLWRNAGSPAPAGDSNPFADVSADAYYAEAVQWAVEQGITNGTSETTFSPDADCTRGQMVTFLYRFFVK